MNTKSLLERAGCKLRIICDQKWSEFEETDEPNIRFCNLCEKLVFYTTTSDQLRSLAKAGQCAFIVPGSPVDEDDRQFALASARIRARGIDKKSFREPSVGMPIILREP
jgi:hypothetical protein